MTAQAQNQPTEAAPSYGGVQVYGLPVGAAEHWIEDGIHVIRGLEFDVIAGDSDFATAVEKFGEKAEDLWIFLSNQERLTENENETFLVLAPRFLAIYKELEKREAKRRQKVLSINFARLRQRGEQHLRNWQPQSTPVSV